MKSPALDGLSEPTEFPGLPGLGAPVDDVMREE